MSSRSRLHEIRPLALLLIGLSGAAAIPLVTSAGEREAPPELGRVAWLRGFEPASQLARETGRPLFVLFQEVPGCDTCIGFGQQVLSHPLLVEAIESEFVPLLVYNNRGGANDRHGADDRDDDDAALPARFGEPAWNNPVVRLLDANGLDLLPRKAGVWQPHEIGERMLAALRAASRPAPAYLQRAVAELTPRRTDIATFAMHCFWSGEACLGEVPGLLSSRAGFLDGREVVEVSFDPAIVSYEALVGEAKRRGCAEGVYSHSDAQHGVASRTFAGAAERTRSIARPAPASDQKRSLQRPPFAHLELTPQQALRANAAVAAGRTPAEILSPRQQRLAGLPDAALKSP